MTIRDQKGKVMDTIPVRRALLSVYDKSGIGEFAWDLVQLNPGILLLSTGGTYKTLQQSLGEYSVSNLREVAEYTGFPEMEGGLVKTLHPKVHAGILGERGNPDHEIYLHDVLSQEGMPADYLDMVVVNLYPFAKKIAELGCTFEQARGNIDIGGPTMHRGAAKNFMSCAVVYDPQDYGRVLETMRANQGCTTFDLRLDFLEKAFRVTAEYDRQIADYMSDQIRNHRADIRKLYGIGA
jgi:phosphoribosylaminoimidazolecarboxamide formyltransferase/IMP cyclohydrolase